MKFTIDYSKWRAGGDQINDSQIGEGKTGLLNEQGYMCCLGQISLQVGEKITEDDIINTFTPGAVDFSIPLLNQVDPVEIKGYRSTDLACSAMAINDSRILTTEGRIRELKELFASEGHELDFINVP